MNKFDVTIIGSGLGGLECAQVLSKEGLNVCVVEKNRQFGGLFQSFVREGHTIDSSVHYVGSMDQGQILHHYFSYFGIMKSLKVERLDERGYDHVHINGEHYSFAMGYDNFVESLSRQFPKEHDSIRRYTESIKRVGDLSSVEVMKTGIFSKDGMEYFTQSAKDEIEKLTGDKKLQNVLWGTSLLYAGDEEVTPFYLHAVTNNSNIQGAYRFKGGANQVTDALADEIRKNGGTLINRSEVKRIVVENDTLKGIMTADDQMIESKFVISNISPSNTLMLIDKNNLIKPAHSARINSNKNTYGMFCLYLIMKPGGFGYLKENHYIKGNSGSINYALVSMQPPVHNSEHAEVVTIITPMDFSELERWAETTTEKRGGEYSNFKESKTEELLNFVSDCFPRLKESIEHKYTATPLTFRDFTANPEGSAYGIKKNYQNPYTTLISPRTRIPNLLLTGQNLNVHGVLGVTRTSMLTCSEIVGGDYLAKKIGNL